MPETNQLLRSAAAFNRDITPAKKATDTLLSRLGLLMASTAESAVHADLSSAVGQPAIEELGLAITGAIGVRSVLIRAHLAAKQVGREHLPELAWGDSHDTPPDAFMAGSAAPHLRVA